jgi:hypothetical protein
VVEIHAAALTVCVPEAHRSSAAKRKS